MKRSFFVLLALSVCGGGYLLADTKLDTKVISASGFEDSVANISQNMLILTSDEIKERGYKDLKEALNSLPNVSVATTGMGQSVDIRGWGEKANSRVKVLVNGVSQNLVDTSHLATPINMINIEDVEQIEVIPGGGSVLYGDKSSGGVINIITKASLNKDYANVSLKFGSFNHKSASAEVGHRFNDNFYANLGFHFTDEKGYQEADKNKAFGGNLGLKYLLDNQSLALNLAYMESKTRNSGALSEKEMQEDRRQGGGGMDMTTFKPFKYIDKDPVKSSKLDVNLKYQNDINDNFQLQLTPFYSKFKGDDGDFINERRGAHLRGKANFDISTTYLGYEFYNDKGTRNAMGKHIAKLKSNSIYALENLQFNELFSLDLGVRYQKVNYDMNRYAAPMTIPSMRPGMPATTIPEARIATKSSANDIAANIAFGFNIDDTNKIYAKIERGFALPEAFEITDKYSEAVGQPAEYHINDLKKETYMNYELGYKGLIANQYASLTLFYTDTKDEIFRDMNGMPPTWKFYNISKTQRYGVEASLTQSLFDDRLELSESIGYISAKAKEDSGSLTSGAKKGEKIPQVSPFNANLHVAYNVIDSLKLRADYSYFSKTKWKFEKEFKAKDKSLNDRKAYGLLNLGITYSPIKNLSISADGKNILGEKYNLSCGKDGKCNPAAKQSFYLEARYTF